ncbi:protein Skeletor, isoforms B/C isoform X2 [Apis mellifera]|uniref:Protein Skeletor, isoforms B/C isoform X2 n=1 Tax=Apis mellifera TaxID=7460 RepID=A0A7M7GQC9_APIME|nr:protein Skeletor, isoforms B/C isoform X2 [Apis mellifera]|eukprot:XP_006563532.2 protein Skeletor, isoforms B/C isoform X2 [Apis mellifera]
MTTQSPTSSTTRLSSIGLVAAVYLLLATQICGAAYYGKLIGKLSELHHGVSGEVYAVDGRTLFIKDFTYDGEAPTAYFYVGTSKSPNGNGIRLRDESGSSDTLKRYRRKDITLTLPDGKTMANIKWFAVWCDEFSVNFGDVRIPRGFDYPKPQKLAALNGVHGVSSEPIVVVDAQTLLIPSFSYDGEAPDAKFWVGAGPTPSPQGIRVPDENGKEQPLRRYDRKAIVLTLPGDVTIHQIGHFGVWCEAFAVDFGHVQIPQGLNVPPSLKMLGVSPQSKLNCEVLEDRLAFEVRWAVAGDSIVAQLVGKLDDGQYMAFGLSADPERSSMVGGDAVVAWVDKQTLQGYAVDYFLDAKSQCSGGRGSCPDTRIQENTNSIRLLNAALVDGYSIVTYQRPLKTNDELDHQILTNRSQPIIWAVGPLNERQEVSFHSDYLKTDRFIDFGRPPIWNCPVPDHEPSQIFTDQNDDKPDQQLVATTRRPYRTPATPAPAPKTGAWEIPPIQCNEPEDGVLYAQMGPTGGKHGYPAITGHVGWGISWYINGLLIPEINVVRGKKYRFVVEGGENPETPARYHPFYITDDPVGGYQHKTPEEKEKVKIFAGVKRQRGVVRPTGVGRLCNWLPDQNQPLADDFTSFGAYQRTLTLECDHGEPGIVEWIPDEDTPDTVYYQCFTHRYLGWKINVHDSCDVEPAGNENHEIYVDPKKGGGREDLEISPSIREASKVTPTADFFQQHPPLLLHHHHHHHPPGEHGLRYSYHQATNPDKLSTPYTQLLTTANNNNNNNNNNYLRLKSSPSPYEEPSLASKAASYNAPGLATRHEIRVKEPHYYNHHHHHHYNHHYNHHQLLQQQQQQQQQLAPIYREQSMGATRLTSSYTPGRHQIMEIQPELLRQSSNQQLSNLVADNPRPLSHGTKYVYPVTSSPQIPQYSRPVVPHHYATNYHHLYHPPPLPRDHYQYNSQQPDQRNQLMLVKRPVLTRRPMLQTAHTMPQPTLALPPRSIFMERKKTVYRPPPSSSSSSSSSYTARRTAERLPSSQGSQDELQIAKLKKIERAKLETKASSSFDAPDIFVTPIKPARNTGFDPDSIVIESGFKPIIRNVESVAQKRSSGQEEEEEEEEEEDETSNRKPTVDNFEPVFIPSPPVPTVATVVKKSRKKSANGKPRATETDDMEAAADRMNVHYLPPISNPFPNNEPPPFPSSSSGVLITFDGKMLKDSSLVRSISGVEEQSKGKLSSDVLSRTPQFGRFKGELPPPIPGEVRSLEDHSRLSDLSMPRTTKNTRLTLVERSKRSPHEGQSVTDFTRTNSSSETNQRGKNSISTITPPVNTGQTIVFNSLYLVLAIIVCHVI